jgi:hypothetical protein
MRLAVKRNVELSGRAAIAAARRGEIVQELKSAQEFADTKRCSIQG